MDSEENREDRVAKKPAGALPPVQERNGHYNTGSRRPLEKGVHTGKHVSSTAVERPPIYLLGAHNPAPLPPPVKGTYLVLLRDEHQWPRARNDLRLKEHKLLPGAEKFGDDPWNQRTPWGEKKADQLSRQELLKKEMGE